MFYFLTYLWLPIVKMPSHLVSPPSFYKPSPTVLLRSSIPHVMDGGQNWVIGLTERYKIWSMFPSCIVQVGPLCLFFKVPSSLLTSARLLISLFYLPLTTRRGLSAHKSIVEDWEGECVPWPPLPQSLTRSHPPHRTYTKWMTFSARCTHTSDPSYNFDWSWSAARSGHDCVCIWC